MEFIVTDEIRDSDRTEILEDIEAYNLERIENKFPKDLGIYVEDDSGRKIAGLIGETHGNWLEVELLWVTESARGQHIGSSILEQAEIVAKERGCKSVFLDTFGFQAPEFYKKQGYTEVFRLTGYPVTGTRHYFTKEL